MLKIIPTQEAINFHYKEVSKIFDKIIEDKYIERGKNKDKIYLNNCFLRFLSSNFGELIAGKPKNLLEIHQNFSKLSFSSDELKNIKSFLIETGYTNTFDKKNFLNHLNIDTCVYCNRNYTTQIVKNRARAELDHWFPKADFPILALSFYNLIPSCHSCNHMKLNNEPIKGWLKALDNLKHPYCDKIDFSFSYNFEDYNKPKAIVKANDKKSENTLNFNKTKEIYEAQSNKELKDLCDLRLKYTNNYLDILCNKTFEGLKLSQEEAFRMVFGIEIEEENYHKRPFSKFKKDIIDELLKIR